MNISSDSKMYNSNKDLHKKYANFFDCHFKT